MPDTSVYYGIAIVLMLLGLAGVILPALPGLPLMFAGMLLAAWADHFQQVGVTTLVILGILTLLSMLVDFFATMIGARRVGASRLALVGAMLGTFAGLFFGPVGLFVGPFAGALVGELAHGRRMNVAGVGQATRVGLGTWLGLAVGIALKLMLALAMLALFAWSWFH